MLQGHRCSTAYTMRASHTPQAVLDGRCKTAAAKIKISSQSLDLLLRPQLVAVAALLLAAV